MLIALTKALVLRRGESYWKVCFKSGKELTEYDIRHGRKAEWLEDLIAAMDIPNVKEVTLCTPIGDFSLQITEPYTVFQFSRGTMAFDLSANQNVKVKQNQIIGRVDDKLTGDCTAIIWDCQLQEAYQITTNVHHFQSWRHDLPDIGALNLSAMDIRL